MTTKSYQRVCEGCGEVKYLGQYPVCFECTTARASAARTCRCGRKARPEAKAGAGRTWTACARCLKTIPTPVPDLQDELGNGAGQ